jgi:tRNA pseudouridine55 synthase
VNGIIVIDKSAGMTSHDVVRRVRRVTDERSVGHLGTLDPMATGVLPLLLGKFTRLAQFFGDADKEYAGTIRFGIATDTYDADGEPVGPERSVDFGDDELQTAVRSLTGKIQQMPPPFSAKKIAGVPAYKLARKGQAPELKPIEVEVTKFSVWPAAEAVNGRNNGPELSILHNIHYRTLYNFHTLSGSGTYVRSLAHDLGQKLGCGAHLASLRRTRSGEFSLEHALTLDELERLGADELSQRLLSAKTILRSMPAVVLRSEETERIRHGNAANLPVFSPAEMVKVFDGDDLIAIARRVAGTLFQPKVVLV